MVVHAYYPVGETRVQREALALVDRGFDVDVLCLRDHGEPRREIIDGITIHRLPIARHRSRGLAWQLLEYLGFFLLAGAVLSGRHLRRRYHSVQVHNLPDFLVFCALVPKLTGTPVILDLHDLMPEFFAAKTGRDLDSRLVRVIAWQERISCRFADHVITVTSRWQKTLGTRAVPIEKVSVVMNVADTRLFAHSPRDRAQESDGCWRVLYHGTFTHRYGVDLLVSAVAAAADEIPDISLDLLGDGEYRDELLALITRLGLEQRVHISDGMLDASLLPDAIRDADVGVVPNRSDIFTDDLLPTKLLEYVAVGTPVVAARTPGVAEYFDDTMVAFFRPGDADALAERLRSLHRDRGRLNDMTAAAAEFNTRHDWRSAADDYADLVRRLGQR